MGAAFPYGTLLINVLGSFAIGLVMVLLTTRLAVSDVWRLLIVTGLLGGFTTFSTFSYETYGLLVTGSWLAAGVNVLGSVGLGMIGVFLGAMLARGHALKDPSHTGVQEEDAMERTDTAQQVWIFVKENDQWHHQPLFLAILDLLRREGVAGATVLRGLAGFGARGHIHTATLVELGSELPVVIIFVDRADRVERVMPQLAAMVQVGLISTTPVNIIQTSHRTPGPFPAHLTVADVMTRDVAHVEPDTPVSEIVSLLIDRALRAVPVVDHSRRVVGIITDGDLLTRDAMDLSVEVQRALPLAERAAQIASLADQPHRAADLMIPNPITLTATTPLAQAAAVMAERKLKRLPVVDDQGRLVGMVSRYDLLKTIAEGLRQRPTEVVQLPAGAPATVGAIMLREVPTVHADTPLAETLDLLLETEKRRVVVVDDVGRVVGIITDGDVIQRASQRARPGGLRSLIDWIGGGTRPEGLEVAARGRTAADVMTSPVVTVTPETPIPEAIRLMMAHKIKRLSVVDAGGRLVGLVGRAGVLAAVSHQHDRDQEAESS